MRSHGSGDGLAKVFFKFYGGLVFTAFRALRMLNEDGEMFDPFSVIELEHLSNCTEDQEAKSPASYSNEAVPC